MLSKRLEIEMDNLKIQPKQWIRYKCMSLMMHLRKRFRNIESEITYPGTKATDDVVDYGCGPGFNTIPLARDVVSDGVVYALDNNPNTIKEVVRKAKKLNLENIQTITSDYPEKIGDESIDIVFLHNVLPYVNAKDNTLAEIRRVLKPAGRLSYMSKKITHIVGNLETGETAMTDEELTRYLENNYPFKLIKQNNGHLIFEKRMN